MKNVNWLLEKDTFEENLEPFKKAILDLGFSYKITEYVPFMENTYHELFDAKDCVVMYGSLQLAREINKCPWVPGVYCDLPKFECIYYYTKLHKFLLNAPYIMVPYGDLINQEEFLFNTISNNDCVFIRPSSGFKTFTGKVIHKSTYEKDVKYLGFYDSPEETICVVAAPQNIQAEWRLVSVDKQIVAASQYRWNGQRVLARGCPDEVTQLAQEITNTWNPEPCWTIDICRLQSGELKLLEIGSFSCAGLYECDAYPIVESVSKQAVKDWEEIYG